MYHPHKHGSAAVQTATAAGALIIPESSLPHGLRKLYKARKRSTSAECKRLKSVLQRVPLEKATILQINGLWFRNTPDGAADDDSIPYLGKKAHPSSPLLYDASGKPTFANPEGRDWALVNGAFQPTVHIQAERFDRWEVINTMGMKVLDLTIRKVEGTALSAPVKGCEFRLLGKDGVPLPSVPRLTSSYPSAGGATNLLLGPANRYDVLVKCRQPGTFVLSSGAGPFRTNYTTCQATNCECFGDANPFGFKRPANNLFARGGGGGEAVELPGAVLAVLEVAPPGSTVDEDFEDDVCRTTLERFYYLDHRRFPAEVEEQCFSFMNSGFGGGCTINNELFPTHPAYIKQGTTQVWEIKDASFHPFHLHETPVRIRALPPCTTEATNMYRVGDWADTIALPACQHAACDGRPAWPAEGSGGGGCGASVTSCDAVTIQFLGTDFANPTGFLPRGRRDACGNPAQPTSPGTHSACSPRASVLHCHVLTHEDEGCMAPAIWWCADAPPAAARRPLLGVCPGRYGPGDGGGRCGAAAAAGGQAPK